LKEQKGKMQDHCLGTAYYELRVDISPTALKLVFWSTSSASWS